MNNLTSHFQVLNIKIDNCIIFNYKNVGIIEYLNAYEMICEIVVYLFINQ
jgi:hypothetical protein